MARLEEAGFVPGDTSTLTEHHHRRRIYYFDDNRIEWEFIEYLSPNHIERNDYE